MIKSLAAFLLVAAVCHAAPDKRPQQYRPAPPPQQYAAPKPRYQQPAQAAYVAAPQENNYGYAPAPSSYNKKPVAILSQDFKLDDYGYKYNKEAGKCVVELTNEAGRSRNLRSQLRVSSMD
ncbi:unnamed protein product, partial [Notodromas monacha]